MSDHDLERSLTKLDHYVGKKIQVIAFGTTYVGRLQKVDYEDEYLILTDGKQVIEIELDRIESYTSIEP